MAVMAGVISSERWLDQVIVTGSTLNLVTGDQSHSLTLPAGSNDLAIMEIAVFVDGMTTVSANPELRGVYCDVIDQANAVRDIVGVQRWTSFQALSIGTYFSPDPLVLWRQGESLRFLFGTVESAGFTGDLAVRAKCVRVRPIETPSSRAVRLVRLPSDG